MKKRKFYEGDIADYGEGFVYDENGDYVSPLDDDYGYWESEQESVTNPLSDDYCKYDNE